MKKSKIKPKTSTVNVSGVFVLENLIQYGFETVYEANCTKYILNYGDPIYNFVFLPIDMLDTSDTSNATFYGIWDHDNITLTIYALYDEAYGEFIEFSEMFSHAYRLGHETGAGDAINKIEEAIKKIQ